MCSTGGLCSYNAYSSNSPIETFHALSSSGQAIWSDDQNARLTMRVGKIEHTISHTIQSDQVAYFEHSCPCKIHFLPFALLETLFSPDYDELKQWWRVCRDGLAEIHQTYHSYTLFGDDTDGVTNYMSRSQNSNSSKKISRVWLGQYIAETKKKINSKNFFFWSRLLFLINCSQTNSKNKKQKNKSGTNTKNKKKTKSKSSKMSTATDTDTNTNTNTSTNTATDTSTSAAVVAGTVVPDLTGAYAACTANNNNPSVAMLQQLGNMTGFDTCNQATAASVIVTPFGGGGGSASVGSGCQVVNKQLTAISNASQVISCCIQTNSSSAQQFITISQTITISTGPKSVLDCPGGILVSNSAVVTGQITQSLSAQQSQNVTSSLQTMMQSVLSSAQAATIGVGSLGTGQQNLQLAQQASNQAITNMGVNQVYASTVQSLNNTQAINITFLGAVNGGACTFQNTSAAQFVSTQMISQVLTQVADNSVVASFLTSLASSQTQTVSGLDAILGSSAFIIIIVIVLLLVVGGALYMSQQKKKKTKNPAQSGNNANNTNTNANNNKQKNAANKNSTSTNTSTSTSTTVANNKNGNSTNKKNNSKNVSVDNQASN